MPLVQEFEYVRATSLEEAVRVLTDRGPEASVLAGGTDLIGWMREDLVAPRVLIDIKGIEGLGGVSLQANVLNVGALATFNDLIASEIVVRDFPLLYEMAVQVASMGIRNRATMVGNICSAVPCCDSGPVLMVYGAEVVAHGPRGERKVQAEEWFRGPRENALADGEIATRVEIPLPEGVHGGAYVRLGRYRGEDLAQASVAALALAGERYRIAFGAVAPTPVRGRKTEEELNGAAPGDSRIDAAKRAMHGEIAPISDVRASEEYRSHMMEVMLERAVRAAVSRRDGAGPSYGTRLV